MDHLIWMFSRNCSTQIQNEAMVLLGAFFIFLGAKISGKVGVALGLLFSWAMLRGIHGIWFEMGEHTGDPTLGRFYEFSLSTVRSMLSIIAISFVALDLKRGLSLFPWIALFQSIFMLLNHGSGIYFNSAVDASFLACTIALFFRNGDCLWKTLSFLPVVAILMSGSWTAFIGLAWCALVYSRTLWAILAALPLALCLPFTHSLTNSYGRVEVWKRAWSFLCEHDWAWVWGMGLGSYSVHEVKDGIWPYQWMSLHNVPYDIFWELGAIGVGLALCAYFQSLWRYRNSVWLLTSLVTTGFCMLTQPLLRNPLGGLFTALLLKEASNE